MRVANAVHLSPPQAPAFFGLPEEGPFVMVSLLNFKLMAEYADRLESPPTGVRAHARSGVEVANLLTKAGGQVRHFRRGSGMRLSAVENLLGAAALAQRPSRAGLLAVARSAQHKAVEPHGDVGLAGQINIPTLPAF